MAERPDLIRDVLTLLDAHLDSFFAVVDIARKTKHPVPVDTRGWSQIIVSALCAIDGIARKKGADLVGGSDVKGANTWEAIDTPRFNGVLKAGTLASSSDRVESLDGMPYLFFVLWDNAPERRSERVRIWCVRPQVDKVFRGMAELWYAARKKNIIRSSNFQLHPPRGRDSNIFTNTYGNLEYPLLFCAERAAGEKYKLVSHNPQVLKKGRCRLMPNERRRRVR